MPVPLQVTYGRRDVGAAGIGWDVPLSYIRRSSSLTHRRPLRVDGGEPRQGFERVVLVLEGREIPLTPIDDGNHLYAAHQDGPQLLVREDHATHRWMVRDGSGFTFWFGVTPRPALDGTGVALLDRIEAPATANAVELSYDVLPALEGERAVSIDLTGLRFDQDEGGTCHKHEITLGYEAPAVAPYSLSMSEELVVVRSRLLTSIDVGARRSCGDEESERLRRYLFEYEPDPDTTMPRLREVRMSGREGSDDEHLELVVQTMEYGAATSADAEGVRALRYARTVDIALPGDAEMLLGSTDGEGGAWVPSGNAYNTWQSLTDVTGDGRPDLVYRQIDELRVAVNRPGVGGATTLTEPGANALLSDATLGPGPLASRALPNERFNYSTGDFNPDAVWRQTIDVNGDGRLDIIDAGESPDEWAIYLNTPGTGSSGVAWLRRSWRLTELRQELESRGYELDDNFIPLSRRYTGRDEVYEVCWQWEGQGSGEPGDDDDWSWFFSPACSHDKPPGVPLLPTAEVTYTEWELADVNGDGYPDFVFGGAPIVMRRSGEPSAGTVVSGVVGFNVGPVDHVTSVQVAFNVAGVRFSDGMWPFAAPESWVDSTACGVSMWVERREGSDLATYQDQRCAQLDVNGDGLLDRFEDASVTLGAGAFLSDVELPLPVAMHPQASARQSSLHEDACSEPGASGATPYHTGLQAGLRDLTGDGIPEWVSWSGSQWQVHIGTGVGFADPVLLDRPPGTGFPFSGSTETCDGSQSITESGLFDIDGDGKPDLVRIVGGVMQVEQLANGVTPRSSDAGRLVAVTTGHGARTEIGWRSAKDDGTTAHQTPRPEMVVGSVKVTGEMGLGGSLHETRFAYGNAHMLFDPRRDAFVLPAYGRTVSVRTSAEDGEGVGTATVADTLPLAPFATNLTPEQRFARYALAGRPADSWTLSGVLLADPWVYLASDMATAADRRGGTHQEWEARATFTTGVVIPSTLDCMDIPDPYDWAYSFGANVGTGYFFCNAQGFGYGRSFDAWRGDAAPPSTANVRTRVESLQVDELGRVVRARDHGDRAVSDDDLCIETIYASPTHPSARVLDAVASKRIHDCSKEVTYGEESRRFDGLPAGQVGLGRPTRSLVEVYDAVDGTWLGTVFGSEVAYDELGNATESVSTREDRATRTVTAVYDDFGIAQLSRRVEADGALPQETTYTHDPVTNDLLFTEDESGALVGHEYDGFGRVVRNLAAAPGEEVGITATTAYLGFDGTDPAGRRITSTTYRSPVLEPELGSAVGRTGTRFLDELGRMRRVESELGADHGGTVVTMREVYDGFGRVVFASQPHPTSQPESSAYGTTTTYSLDGTPACSVLGHGPQSLTTLSTLAERFPTCYVHAYVGSQEVVTVRSADSFDGSAPQRDVVRQSTSTALGRLVSRRTLGATGTPIEASSYAYDRLGRMSQVTRYRSPSSQQQPVTWTTRFDSLGRTLYLEEPESARREYAYSSWGELEEVRWDGGGIAKAIRRTYDGLGRVTHAADVEGGVEVPETIYDYIYDAAAAPVPQASDAHQLGRLAQAKSPLGDQWFGYDAWGRQTSHTAADDDGHAYVQRTYRAFDGSLEAIDFHLPDADYKQEHVKYEYDSAGFLRRVAYAGPNDESTLYEAEDIDPWGRVRTARHGDGAVTSKAEYAETGRRLLRRTEVVGVVDAWWAERMQYDALGREGRRRERSALSAPIVTTQLTHDSIGRLSRATKLTGGSPFDVQYGYDALGNVTMVDDLSSSNDVAMTASANDRDRLCRVLYGGSPSSQCNVGHDTAGNVGTMPTRSGVQRSLSYFPSGQVRRVSQGSAVGSFRYDPFGSLAELVVEGSAASEKRHDRHYGSLIERRDQGTGSAVTSVIVRNVPGPDGIAAVRRGPTAKWVFPHSDDRGARVYSDQTGALLQKIDYRPFGQATSSGAQPGSASYNNLQWNGGDALASFGLSKLGARLYDPVIGRFLSRDPLRVQRTAAKTNPYSFALNDPWNESDPSGMDVSCDGGNCPGPGDGWFPGSGGGGGGGGSSGGGPRPYPVPPPSPTDPMGGPTYDITFNPDTDLKEASAEEAAYFMMALNSLVKAQLKASRVWGRAGLDAMHDLRRKDQAATAVTQYRYRHRLDGQNPLQREATLALERLAIADAQSRRILTFGPADAADWAAAAGRTPSVIGAPVGDKRVWEVWAHGTTQAVLADMKGTIARMRRDGFPSEGGILAIVACETGALDSKAVQAWADEANAIVVAPIAFVHDAPGVTMVGELPFHTDYPVMAPAGYNYYFPRPRPQ